MSLHLKLPLIECVKFRLAQTTCCSNWKLYFGATSDILVRLYNKVVSSRQQDRSIDVAIYGDCL